ncbi:MAG: serine/threonine-protein kinase [Bacillota bacterium]
MLQVGQLFDEKYEIIKVLGSGGMGTVYLARNIKLNNLWAIKEVLKANGEKVDLLAEPNILKKLNHPSLPRIFDIIEDENSIYIIIDYMEGTSLEAILKEKGRIEEKTVIDWGKQICEILAYLHNQTPNPIIYRDMKPSNLILTKNSEIKLIDFGISREYKRNSSTDTTYIGTRGFAAPEQYGFTQTDARTDIYSLGVTLYYLLTSRSLSSPPFEIIPVRKINRRFSKGIEFIINKCTEQNPDKRYKSVKHLLADLNDIDRFENRRRKAYWYKILIVFTVLTLLVSPLLIAAGRTNSNNTLFFAGLIGTIASLICIMWLLGSSMKKRVSRLLNSSTLEEEVGNRVPSLAAEDEEEAGPQKQPTQNLSIEDELKALKERGPKESASKEGVLKESVLKNSVENSVEDTVVLNDLETKDEVQDTVLLNLNPSEDDIKT